MRIHWAVVGVGAIAALLSFAASESMSGQRTQKQSVTFGVSGRLQAGLANGKPGIFDLADCQEQSGSVIPVSVRELAAGVNSATMQKRREQIVRDAVLAEAEGTQINFACYSWGATLCLRVVQDLAKLMPPVPVETMVLVDRIDLGYPGEKPDNGINGNPVVPDNVKTVFAVRQELTFPCSGVPPLCGGPVTSTVAGPRLKQILMSANSPDPEGPALLDRVLQEFRVANGHDPRDATELHTFMDQSQTIRELSGAWVGRPCTRRKCGNGKLDRGEECDDGNVATGDGCRADCTLERCGDVIPDPGEQCDDGNLVDGDGCDSNCTPTGCGNGIVTMGEQCDGMDDAACPGQCVAVGQPNQCRCQQVQVEEVSTRSGWTGDVLATRRKWAINGQQFVEVIRYGATKRICPETGVFLDCPQTWNVWKFVSLPGYFITPGATPPSGASVTVKPDNIVTEGCDDLDPARRFSSGPPTCPQTVVSDNTFIASTSPTFFFPLCFSTHSCAIYDPASPYLGTTGYASELQTGCIMEPCPAQYDCPPPCVQGSPTYPACLTQGHCPAG